jgi:hypothetical protein
MTQAINLNFHLFSQKCTTRMIKNFHKFKFIFTKMGKSTMERKFIWRKMNAKALERVLAVNPANVCLSPLSRLHNHNFSENKLINMRVNFQFILELFQEKLCKM